MAKQEIRPIRVEGQVAYVPLTQDNTAIIDAADVHLVEGVNWHLLRDKRTFYAVRNGTGASRTKIYMHRVLVSAAPGHEVDHVNGDGLDNRRSNMRVATHAENTRNARTRQDNTSGAKGVRLDTRTGKWQARITSAGKPMHLGLFTCRTAAALAYIKASRDLHGEFGRVA